MKTFSALYLAWNIVLSDNAEITLGLYFFLFIFFYFFFIYTRALSNEKCSASEINNSYPSKVR